VSAGRQAEEKVAAFLKEKGYVIMARNFAVRGGEIDLVAWDGDTLVFVEVKSSSYPGNEPLEAVDSRKMRRMAGVADRFLADFNITETQVRYDVVSVTPQGIKHFQDAFRPY